MTSFIIHLPMLRHQRSTTKMDRDFQSFLNKYFFFFFFYLEKWIKKVYQTENVGIADLKFIYLYFNILVIFTYG